MFVDGDLDLKNSLGNNEGEFSLICLFTTSWTPFGAPHWIVLEKKWAFLNFSLSNNP